MTENPREWDSGLTNTRKSRLPQAPSVWGASMPSTRFVSTPTVSQGSMPFPALFYSCISVLHGRAQSHAHNPSYQQSFAVVLVPLLITVRYRTINQDYGGTQVTIWWQTGTHGMERR